MAMTGPFTSIALCRHHNKTPPIPAGFLREIDVAVPGRIGGHNHATRRTSRTCVP